MVVFTIVRWAYKPRAPPMVGGDRPEERRVAGAVEERAGAAHGGASTARRAGQPGDDGNWNIM